MQILHIAAEMAPLAKVGGLGDVIHGLSRTLIRKGHQVNVLLPKYATLNLDCIEGLKRLEGEHTLLFDGTVYSHSIWKGSVDSIPVYLIEPEASLDFFSRSQVYGWADDIARFSYFCLAALEFIRKFSFDALHLHDWHTGMVAGLIKELHPEIESTVVFTIHNLAYLGLCRGEDLDRVGWKSPLLREGGLYSLLKAGIIFSDKVTTVSPNYAHEIMTTELGGSLQETLQHAQHKFSGILNGIDYGYWDPEQDPYIPYHFSPAALQNKLKVKSALREKMGLAEEEDSPIVGCVTRLVYQKGPELIKASLLRTLEWGGQFILLGSTADQQTHTQFLNLKKKLAGSRHVHIELTYNEELSHLLYAGADLFLVPSLFEPCGLTQLIAMRYGTLPLVRATGGLADTVFEDKNGFVFGPPTIEGIHGALDRALTTWYQKPQRWKELQRFGMESDYSWNLAADAYLKLYTAAKAHV